jgi:hypothetical protein
MLASPTAKFHIGLVPQRWYTDSSVMEVNFHSEPTISVFPGQESSTVEPIAETTFSHLENIRDNYVFTEEVRKEISQKQQYGRGFGIMKKTLNLAIATGRTEELYEIHLKLANEMEAEIINQVKNGDNIAEFASTISNPLVIKKKGRKPKDFDRINNKKRESPESDRSDAENSRELEDVNTDRNKKKKRKKETPESDQSNKENIGSNDLINGGNSKKRMCGVCNEKGHNARTCPMKGKITS